ncbi:MAG: hypothetical protein KDC43_23510, partial [Saprospiraceae bacterium]|nr:hypothetical protein [Saprospiraceae bacterium]
EPFEAQVLSAVRRQRILQTQPPPAPEAASVPSLIASATPQGLIARVESAGPWKEVILAENTIGYTSPNYQNHSGGSTSVTSPEFKLGFINLSQTLKEAFLTNQQFLVCTDAAQLGALFTDLEAAGTPSETTADPVFNNKMYLQEWPFFLQTGKNGSVAGEYRNILICKFCKGALVDWVKNPAVWTQAGDFNDPTELRQLSQWLQDYLAEAQGQ